MRVVYLVCGLLVVLGMVLVGAWRAQHHSAPLPRQTVKAAVDYLPPDAAYTHDFAVPVLMYHRICDLSPREARSPLVRDLTVSPQDFEAQIRYLVEHNFAILSVQTVEQALHSGQPLPERAVALTMDDGYRDNFTRAFPILREYGVPATIFLVTSVVGDGAHVSWDDARQMQRRRISFESHTVHHPDLPSLPDEPLQAELVQSKATIEAQLSTVVRQIAYPSGRFDARVVDATRNAGYAIGWQKGGGPVEPGDDPYRLPRVRVHGRTSMQDFERKVMSGVYTITLRDPGV